MQRETNVSLLCDYPWICSISMPLRLEQGGLAVLQIQTTWNLMKRSSCIMLCLFFSKPLIYVIWTFSIAQLHSIGSCILAVWVPPYPFLASWWILLQIPTAWMQPYRGSWIVYRFHVFVNSPQVNSFDFILALSCRPLFHPPFSFALGFPSLASVRTWGMCFLPFEL